MAELNIPTLRGDVRDALLTHVKSLPKPWQQMSQLEQELAITRAESLADNLVRQAVALAGARGFEHYEVSLGKYAIDKGIEGKFSAPYSTDLVEALGTRRGATFLLVPCDINEFLGQQAAATPEPDQRQFFDDGGDDDFPPADDEGDEDGDPEPDEQDRAAEVPPPKRMKDYDAIKEDAGL